MLCVGMQTLQVQLEEHELEQITASARAEGRTVQDYARDTLLSAAAAQASRRREALLRVVRISAALNERLARLCTT